MCHDFLTIDSGINTLSRRPRKFWFLVQNHQGVHVLKIGESVLHVVRSQNITLHDLKIHSGVIFENSRENVNLCFSIKT